MSAVHFEVHIEGVEELDARWRGTFVPRLGLGATQSVLSAIEAGVTVAKALVPVSAVPKGTHLRDVIAGKIVSGEGGEGGWAVTGEISAPKRYGVFVEQGTKAHEIRPKNRSVLAFQGSLGTIFSMVVHHPGTAPHPFMGPAYLAAERRLEAQLELAIANATAAFGG